jgi:hypothetical protein
MNRPRVIAGLIVLSLAGVVVYLVGQRARQGVKPPERDGGVVAARAAPRRPLYDPQRVDTISGTAEGIRVHAKQFGTLPSGAQRLVVGAWLRLRTGKDLLAVFLGRPGHLRSQGMRIEPNDTVEVRGSWVERDNERIFVAARIRKGDQTVELRREDGTLVWAGRRMRGFRTQRK